MRSDVFRSDRVAQRQKADHLTRCYGNITELPKAEHDTPEWQATMEALLLVAENSGTVDVRPHRCHEGIESSRRTRVRPVAEGQALGTTEVGAGSMIEFRAAIQSWLALRLCGLAPLLGGFSFRAREGPSPTASSHSCRDQPAICALA